jgi:histone deacetylase complex regulatory component SIN3
VHVQGLFKDAPDLLREFKDFLPENEGIAGPSGVVGILPQPSGASGALGPSWGQSDNGISGGIDPADKGIKKPISSLKRKKKVVDKDVTPVPPVKSSANRVRYISFPSFIYAYHPSRPKDPNTITREIRQLFPHIKRLILLRAGIHTRMFMPCNRHSRIPRSLARLMDAP